jgi:hypothetical protein
MLLSAGADVNSKSNNDDDGAERTAVMTASKCGNTKIVNLLLSAGADVDMIDLQIAHNNKHPIGTYGILNRHVSKDSDDMQKELRKDSDDMQKELRKDLEESERKSNQLQMQLGEEKAEQANAWRVKAGVYALFALAAVGILFQHKGAPFHPLAPVVPYEPVAPSAPPFESPNAESDVPMASPVGCSLDNSAWGYGGTQKTEGTAPI